MAASAGIFMLTIVAIMADGTKITTHRDYQDQPTCLAVGEIVTDQLKSGMVPAGYDCKFIPRQITVDADKPAKDAKKLTDAKAALKTKKKLPQIALDQDVLKIDTKPAASAAPTHKQPDMPPVIAVPVPPVKQQPLPAQATLPSLQVTAPTELDTNLPVPQLQKAGPEPLIPNGDTVFDSILGVEVPVSPLQIPAEPTTVTPSPKPRDATAPLAPNGTTKKPATTLLEGWGTNVKIITIGSL